ncbi:unnamed protein product [Brassica rapa]|uniref:Uncharacterized protein n=2 Tax=Brassica TaxID=3705 RepID=A0A3P6D9X6_BRACM|nr:unnamed protein product [Brassica napus]CAF2323188.1 unnamed protein product [Brassica napus]CAG7909753.1 unnamed protein product [Brassica rapa]CDY72145.1 BnaUnng04880D [Brassica napus]VDD17352.1 unnamed protein product [Brassica rapa]
MANTFVLLGDLKAGLYFSTILVRLLRFWWCGWEPRNSRRGGELMGADMFLLDAKKKFHRQKQGINSKLSSLWRERNIHKSNSGLAPLQLDAIAA